MWEDEVLDEIYKIREQHAKEFNYDTKAIGEDWLRRQAEKKRKQSVSLSTMDNRSAKQEENAKQEEVIQTK